MVIFSVKCKIKILKKEEVKVFSRSCRYCTIILVIARSQPNTITNIVFFFFFFFLCVFVSSPDWPSDRHASSCQLQWHHSGRCTEGLCGLGVVRSRGAGSQPLDRWWRNPIGPQSGKCSLLFRSGEYDEDFSDQCFFKVDLYGFVTQPESPYVSFGVMK